MEQRLEQLAEARHKVELGGGEDKIEKQHAKGKLTRVIIGRCIKFSYISYITQKSCIY